MITIKIDGREVTVPSGTTVLEAARLVGIEIPTLCYHPEMKAKSTCRICVVEDIGSRRMKTACNQPVDECQEIITNSERVRSVRKTILQLILADHPQDCLNCVRNTKCDLQDLVFDAHIMDNPFDHVSKRVPLTVDNPSLVRDNTKCIKCGRCVDVCHEVQVSDAIGYSNRSHDYSIGSMFEHLTDETTCVLCGQCINVCPVGALRERDDIDLVWDAIQDPGKLVVFQTAPSVRVGIGDDFGMEPGAIATGAMVAGIRRLGVDKVIDTNFAADLTIMEEGTELLDRMEKGGTLPMITSCCPGWINYAEKNYPELLSHLSSCKSPQQMFGAIIKTYYAKILNVDPANMFVVSVMPCITKKYEAKRPEMNSSGFQDVDAVLTTRELSRMLKQAGLDLRNMEEDAYDSILGFGSGAATIFGASGGVMEAALRTVYEIVTGEDVPSLEFTAIRGHEGIKEAEVDLKGTKVKVAITNGLSNAKMIMEKIKQGEADYQFIEVMCCPGGCVGGGGQPYRTNKNTRLDRMEGLYEDDRHMPVRKSHKNPDVQHLYQDYLDHPNSHIAHELLHTRYNKNRKTKA